MHPYRILLLLVLWALPSLLPAQNRRGTEDVLYLYNGSVIRGEILEHRLGEWVQIEVASGQIFRFPTEEIERITIEPPLFTKLKLTKYRHLVPITYRQRGFYHQLDWGVNFTEGQWGPVPSTGLHYRILYHQNQWLNYGLGTGWDFYSAGIFTPLFAELQGDLWQKPVTPIYLLQLGYGYPTSMSSDHEVLQGGWMGQIALGVKLNTRQKSDVYFTIGYKFQDSYQEFREWPRDLWNVPPGAIIEPSLVTGTRFYQRIHYQISISL